MGIFESRERQYLYALDYLSDNKLIDLSRCRTSISEEDGRKQYTSISEEDVRKQYKQFILFYHPDKCVDKSEEAMQIFEKGTKAYMIILSYRREEREKEDNLNTKRAQLEELPRRELEFRARCIDPTYNGKRSPLTVITRSQAFIEAHQKAVQHEKSGENLLEYPKSICDICYTETFDGKGCVNNHFICKQCLPKWVDFKFEQLDLLLSCPADPKCKYIYTAFEMFQFLQDKKIEEKYHQMVFVKYKLGKNFITCDKCGYGEEYDEEDLIQIGYIWQCIVPETLKPSNYGCQKVYCLRCVPVSCLADNFKQYLEISQKNPHICKKDPKLVMRSCIADIIANAYFTSCPNDDIKFVKESGCNCVKCTHCNLYFCYLCSSKLGTDGARAHDLFNIKTHHNKKQLCGLFESEEDEKVIMAKARILITNRTKKEKWDINVVSDICRELLPCKD